MFISPLNIQCDSIIDRIPVLLAHSWLKVSNAQGSVIYLIDIVRRISRIADLLDELGLTRWSHGRELNQWVNRKHHQPAGWIVHDGVLTVHEAVGNIETRRRVPPIGR